MSEFLEDPSVLTKEKLKSELLANNVVLPSGEQRKDVYVQLYLQNLTVQNKPKKNKMPPETFSSDDELPPPVVANKNRSGRKATRKTDKPRPEDLDVTELSDEDLKDQLMKYGVNAGPVVASTRKLYEKKLQKLLDHGPPEMQLPQPVPALAPTPASAPPKAVDSNQNGNTDCDQYSDNEADEKPEPVVEKLEPVKPRAKVPVNLRTRRLEHNKPTKPQQQQQQQQQEEDDEDRNGGEEHEQGILNVKRKSRRQPPPQDQTVPASDDTVNASTPLPLTFSL